MFAFAKGWRTMIIAVAVAGAGAVQAVGLATVIPAPYVGVATLGLGLLMAYLRSVTDTSVGVK